MPVGFGRIFFYRKNETETKHFFSVGFSVKPAVKRQHFRIQSAWTLYFVPCGDQGWLWWIANKPQIKMARSVFRFSPKVSVGFGRFCCLLWGLVVNRKWKWPRSVFRSFNEMSIGFGRFFAAAVGCKKQNRPKKKSRFSWFFRSFLLLAVGIGREPKMKMASVSFSFFQRNVDRFWSFFCCCCGL